MTHDESAHDDSEDRFYVQFDSREVELMTLDEIQAAFEAGQIHENTFLCREGDSEWITLAVVAGLGEEEPEAEAEAAPVVERRPPMPERRPEVVAAGNTRPPMPERRPDMVTAETRPAMPQRRPEMSTQPAARFQQSVPPVAPSAPAPSLSFAPVTSNVEPAGLDFDELSMRPKRRWGLVLAAAAVLAVAGGGTVFALNGNALASAVPDKAALEAAASHSQAALTLSNVQAKPVETAAPVAPSTPEPVAAATPAPAAEAPKSNGLSEDMKQALLASDKTRETTKKAKKSKGRAAAAAPHKSGGKVANSGGGGFKSGGSAYDPLNGKL